MRSRWLLPLLLIVANATGAEALVDPTRPSGMPVAAGAGDAAPSPALKLTLIRLGPQPLAIVNGRPLRPGDVIDGRRLTAIQPGRVLLAGSDGPLELRLLPARAAPSHPSIKRRSPL